MADDDATTTHFRTCPLCEATCGLEITMLGDTVKRIRGDRDDVFSHGFICPKGSTLKQLHEDPDRLHAPVIRRRGGAADGTDTWDEVSWDEAFAEIERRLVPLIDEHGRDAVAVYLGNPSAHNLAGTLYSRAVIKSLGTRNLYSASTVDQMPKHVSSGLLFGSGDSIPVPDLDRTDHLLLLGANPWESNGSLCTAPDFPGRLKAIQARGGRFVVVDPRRTRTAEEADEHVFIRPGGDAFLLLALLHVVFARGLDTAGDVTGYVDGVDELRELVAPFSPEAVAGRTGIDAATTERLAVELGEAPTAAVYGRIGTHTVGFGTLAAWAVDALNIVTGNLDRPGGAMFPHAAHQPAPKPFESGERRPGRGFTTGRHASRVKGFPEVRSELPIATLADEIETPGEGQVRALVVIGGNPVLSTPDSDRLAAALDSLDFMVSVDPYRNETSRFADVILPPPSPLTRSHYDLAFTTLSVRNVSNWSAPVLETDEPPEEDILARLALVIAGQGAEADPAVIHDMLLDGVLKRTGKDPEQVRSMLDAERPIDRILEVMVRSGVHGDRFGDVPDGLTFATLRDSPHGIDFGPLTPRVPDILKTASGAIEVMTDPIRAELARATEAIAVAVAADPGLLLVGRRHLRSNNSWMHNVNVLVKGKARCTLQMNPDDAAHHGLTDGGAAKIASRVGSLVVPVEVTDDVMPGVVSLPHGWGHGQPGTQMAVAAAHAGVNTNVLTDGAELDPLSGNAVLNGIPVTVVPA